MHTEDQNSMEAQRRQFGRRDASRRASAQLPGGTVASCMIVNISEGGALVDFADEQVPTRHFRLTIEGAPYVMLCEPRHSRGSSVGIKFVNHSDGARLMAHLFPGPTQVDDRDDTPQRDRGGQAAPAITNRGLRRQVLASLAERAVLSASEPLQPSANTLTMQIIARLATLTGKLATTTNSPVANGLTAASTMSTPAIEGPASPPALLLTDEISRGYQPKRSRRNGIKGKSAGGIG